MGAPKSFLGTPDARAFLNRAIQAEHGIRAVFPTRGLALAFRHRCYTQRDRDRKMQAKLNPEATIVSSVWDTIMLNIKHSSEVGEQDKDLWYLYAIHSEDGALSFLQIEELGGGTED